MFQTQVTRSNRRAVALITSFVLHCVFIYVWLPRPAMFVRASSVAWGRGGRSETLVYFTPAKPAEGVVSKRSPLRIRAQKKGRPDLPEKAEARAGSNTGSMSQG